MMLPLGQQRRRLLHCAAAGALAPWCAAAAPAPAQVLRVGPGEPLRTLAAAARVAKAGALIEVQAGDYVGDVAVWRQDEITLRAVGGRVRMLAAGAHAEGKGIFVTSGRRITIEGFDFFDATVPDTNGAGVRLESGSLTVRDCSFSRCEGGLLTSNDPTVELTVENCEFSYSRRPPGKPAHLLYIGRIAQATVRGCYFHHAMTGHLIKSRAARSLILYNRLTDEIGGTASYELEFPDGGIAVAIGNLIQQGSQTENPFMVAFGAEGYKHPRNELWLVHNTLVDDLPRGGSYLRVGAGAAHVHAINNLLVGGGRFSTDSNWDVRNNLEVDLDAFVRAARFDYTLKPGSTLRGRVVDPGPGPDDISLRPTHQYQHPRGTLALNGPARNPGAIQQP